MLVVTLAGRAWANGALPASYGILLPTDKPQQIAVPFPAPYPVGKGVMSVMGEGKDITVWMTPGWTVPILSGIATKNVWWDTKPNC